LPKRASGFGAMARLALSGCPWLVGLLLLLWMRSALSWRCIRARRRHSTIV
jgi:hypothetical protein